MGNKKNYYIRSKIWIEDNAGNVIFGLGRYRILSAIDSYGSINAAAKSLKMSYRGVWAKIKTTEDALGKPLLVKNTGGKSGGGSQLTPYAKSLLKKFKDIHCLINEKADNYFDDVFAPKLK